VQLVYVLFLIAFGTPYFISLVLYELHFYAHSEHQNLDLSEFLWTVIYVNIHFMDNLTN